VQNGLFPLEQTVRHPSIRGPSSFRVHGLTPDGNEVQINSLSTPFPLPHDRGRSQDRSRYPGSVIRPSTIVPRPGSLETSSVPPIASRRSTMPCNPVP
jgi:hypothetical protein